MFTVQNLTARMPSVVSSSTSSSPWKRCYGNQDPWRFVVADDRSGQIKLSSAGFSELDYDRAWSSQEWKSEVTAHDQGNLIKLLGEYGTKSSSSSRRHSSRRNRVMLDQGNLIISTLKKWQILKVSSWEEIQQN